MFDIGFFELLLIAVVGLVVIGPERLPGTLRKLALYWGRIKRSISDTRQEIEQQIGADDIRRQLHNEEVMERLAKAEAELNKSLDIDEPNKASEQSAATGSDETKAESSSEPQAAAEKPQPTSEKTAS